MCDGRCVIINLKSAFAIILIFVISGIRQGHTAINLMEVPTKVEVQKNNTVDSPVTIVKNLTEISSCSVTDECKNLKFPCIRCQYNSSCIYGKDINVTCEARPNVQCQGEKSFTRLMNCRYCYQTELWQQTCVQRGDCNSVHQYYKTNCTAHDNVLCLGNRTFSRNLKCNWTQGYRWSTALLISLTLGGFGADRFYLGHWPEGIGKLFSFGGLGVWTIIDVLLISLHYLGPADGSLYI